MNIEDIKASQEEAIQEMKMLCKSGIYTQEELKNIEEKGAEITAKWINSKILEDLINLAENNSEKQ